MCALASLAPHPKSRTIRLYTNYFSVSFSSQTAQGLSVHEYSISFSDSSSHDLSFLAPLQPFFFVSKTRILSLASSPSPSAIFSTCTLTYIGPVHLPANSPELLRLFHLALRSLTDARASFSRVGRSFFAVDDSDRSSLHVVSGFHISISQNTVGALTDIGGHLLHCDTVYRAVHRKTVLDTLSGASEDEWTRRCVNSLVLAVHNNRVYRVKRVLFDLSPSTLFEYKEKLSNQNVNHANKKKEVKKISYIEFYRKLYNRGIYDLHQPLLEAYAEKQGERVVLVPELCCLTGLTEDMRKDRVLMNDLLGFTMVSGGSKLTAAANVAHMVLGAASPAQPSLGRSGIRRSSVGAIAPVWSADGRAAAPLVGSPITTPPSLATPPSTVPWVPSGVGALLQVSPAP